MFPSCVRLINFRLCYVSIVALIKNIKFSKCSISNHYLIFANGFHEWKHLDEKGKTKEQYLIKVKDQPISTIGGLYNVWTDPETGNEINTVTVVTTQANELMAEIHNTKQRMPIMLNKRIQYRWLDDNPLVDFEFPNYDPELEAEIV